jgi:hypothetical protein
VAHGSGSLRCHQVASNAVRARRDPLARGTHRGFSQARNLRSSSAAIRKPTEQIESCYARSAVGLKSKQR